MSDTMFSLLEKISVSLANDSTIKNRSKLLALIVNTREQMSKVARIQHSRNTFFTSPAINLDPILNLITALQINIEQHDYLARSHSTTPLAVQPIKETAIPAIYNAVTLLVSMVIDQKERELKKLVGTSDVATLQADALLSRFDSIQNATRELDTPITTYTIDNILNALRLHLITHSDNLPIKISAWAAGNYTYTAYPTKQFELYKILLDRVEIDRILLKKHYSNVTLQEAVESVNIDIDQPSFVTLRTDETAQYDIKTGSCFRLNSPHTFDGKIREEKLLGNYPVRLISVGISNCHTLLIKDEYGHIWMLHVSPNAIQQHTAFASFMRSKPAYADLGLEYANENIQLKGNIEVIVIEKNQTSFREALLLRNLPWRTKIVAFKRIEVDAFVDLTYKYSVCYATDTNEIVISGVGVINESPRPATVTIPHAFKTTATLSSTDKLSDEYSSDLTDADTSAFLISLKTNIEHSDTIKDKTTLISVINDVTSKLTANNLDFLGKYNLLLEILRKLQANIKQYDYLNRRNATTSLAELPIKREHIPYIYNAVTLLLDLLIRIKKSGNITIRASDGMHTAARQLRVMLATNEQTIHHDIAFWIQTFAYRDYLRMEFSEHHEALDAIEIDMIMQNIHYSNIPIERALFHPGFDDIESPSKISLERNTTILYNPATRHCFNLDIHFRDEIYNQLKYSPAYPLQLVSSGITSGHTVLINDEENRLWMFHVTQSAVTRKEYTDLEKMIGPPRLAFSDLSGDYDNDEIKLTGKLDIIVVDNPNGCFNRELLESQLPKNTEIASLRMIEADLYFKETKTYSVSYLPESDQLTVMGYQRVDWELSEKVMKFDNLFHAPTLNFACR